jgi:hypothetical protein
MYKLLFAFLWRDFPVRSQPWLYPKTAHMTIILSFLVIFLVQKSNAKGPVFNPVVEK